MTLLLKHFHYQIAKKTLNFLTDGTCCDCQERS